MDKEYDYDLCIIGGGVNGTGIARDAAGQGLKVLLLEQDDLASHTSSASSKLIHGGLRYLEYYEFRLVHEALRERDVLLDIAPHIIWPLNFILPDAYSVRPFWLIRLGLYLYDVLSFSFQARRFPLSRAFNLRKHVFGDPLKKEFFLGVLYSDGWVQDSRLVVLNAMDAKAKGAVILTRTKCTGLEVFQNGWKIGIRNPWQGDASVTAHIVVNAAGPWVRDILDHAGLATAQTPSVRHVQGSHIVVPKLYDGEQAYMIQQPDKRIVFVLPYEHHFTLIGTTDNNFKGDPAKVEITQEEKDYLISAANKYFTNQINGENIVWSFSGIRPLHDDDEGDAKKITRDYKIHSDVFGRSHLISAFGGKITTYRKLSENVTQKVMKALGKSYRSWTGKRPLPGGDISFGDFNAFLRSQKIRWEHENVALLKRYARAYGTKMIDILSQPKGAHYGNDVYESEIRYLVRHEFALSVDDILWRRSKLGLHISDQTKANLQSALPSIVKEITGHDI